METDCKYRAFRTSFFPQGTLHKKSNTGRHGDGLQVNKGMLPMKDAKDFVREPLPDSVGRRSAILQTIASPIDTFFYNSSRIASDQQMIALKRFIQKTISSDHTTVPHTSSLQNKRATTYPNLIS